MLQSNPWSCFPICVSILTEIAFDKLIKVIGHDGSKIVYPERMDISRYEAFSLDEIGIALLKLGWSATSFKACIKHKGSEILLTNYPDLPEISKLLTDLKLPTIITIQKEHNQHCLAWKPQTNTYIDPLTGIEKEAWYDQPMLIVDFIVLARIKYNGSQ